MLVLIVLTTSCSLLQTQPLQVQTKVVLPKPLILESPVAPSIKTDPVIIITAEEAKYYEDACNYFTDTPTEGLNEEVIPYQGLDVESTCRWAIVGYTVQGWLNLEQQLVMIDAYTKSLRFQLDFYKTQLQDRYKAAQDVDKD